MSKNLHFFKIHSRIGMKNLPYKGTSLNFGVEEGADYILSAEFLNRVSDQSLTVEEFTFSNPESIEPQKFNQVLAGELNNLQNLIISKLSLDEMSVAVGGDHTLSFSTINALLARVKDPAEIGYIQFDTHPDMLKEKESTTKNFHGMYLRPLIKTDLGVDFDIPEINVLVSRQLDPERMVFIGNLDAEEAERRFFIESQIKNITKQKLLDNLEEAKKWLSDWIGQFEYLHINFDIDVFDQSVVSATGCPSPNGLLPEQVFPLLEILSTHPKLSLDLVEVNPKKPGAEQAIAIAQSVVAIILGKNTVRI